MKRLLLPLLCLACACLPASVSAQTTTDAAKADGKAFGRDQAAAAQSAATTDPDANRIPNFGDVPNQSGYFDDPDRMAREAASQATANTGYRTMRDSMDRRAQFAPQDLDAVVARSNVINDDPLSYTSGMSISGSQGRCVPLPPGTGAAARYMATCNVGYTATQETRTCPVTLNATIQQRQVYGYYCVGGSGVDPASIYNCNRYPAPQCTVTQSYPINLCDPYLGIYWGCNSGDLRVDLVSCTAPVDGATPAPSPAPPWPGAVLSGCVDEDGVPTWLAQAGQVRGEQVRLMAGSEMWMTCSRGWSAIRWVEVRAPRAVAEPETERVPWWAAVGRWTTGDELIVEVARTSVVPVVTVEGGGRVRVAPDGTVEVLARDGDQ